MQRSGDNLLRVPKTIHSGGINPVNSEFERPVNCCDRLRIILCSPAILPITTQCPRAESNRRDSHIRIPKPFHFDSEQTSTVCLSASLAKWVGNDLIYSVRVEWCLRTGSLCFL